MGAARQRARQRRRRHARAGRARGAGGVGEAHVREGRVVEPGDLISYLESAFGRR